MAYFSRYQASDKELWDRVFNRYQQIYPEAAEPDFEPSFSGHDEDWDIIYGEESKRLTKELEDEAANPPKKEAKKSSKKSSKNPKKSKKSKKKGSAEPVENCSSRPPTKEEMECYYDGLFFTANSGGEDGNEICIDEYNPQTKSYFELVCGHSEDKGSVKVETGGHTTGPCATHKNKVFYAYGDNHSVKSKSDDAMEISVFSNHVDEQLENGINDISQHNFGLDHKPEKVKLGINRCGRKNELVFHIYPKYDFSISGNIKYKDTKYQDSGKDVNVSQEDKAKKWSEVKEKKITFSKTYNGVKFDFGQKLEQKLDFEKLFLIVGKIQKFGKDYFSDIFSFDIFAPNITLTGGWKYGFNPKTYSVSPVGSIKIEAKPIIGIKASISILKAGLAMYGAGPLLKLPRKVKEWTNGAAELDFDVVASIAGNINASIEQKFQYNDGFSTKIECTIEVALEISLIGKVDAYVFSVTASVKANACSKYSASFSLSQLFLPAGSFRLGYDGLTITLVCYLEAGILWWATSSEKTWTWTPIDAHDIHKADFDLNA